MIIYDFKNIVKYVHSQSMSEYNGLVGSKISIGNAEGYPMPLEVTHPTPYKLTDIRCRLRNTGTVELAIGNCCLVQQSIGKALTYQCLTFIPAIEECDETIADVNYKVIVAHAHLECASLKVEGQMTMFQVPKDKVPENTLPVTTEH